MLVTRKDLAKHGCTQNQSWFYNRLVGNGHYRLEDNKLWVIYSTTSIKQQLESYRVRLKKYKHLDRHKSGNRIDEVLLAVNTFEEINRKI